jgi:Protein of unknown function (DUF2889)
VTGSPVDPRRGTNAPTSWTPPRRRGSVRRTTTFDSLRPDGLDGEIRQRGCGRDLWTSTSGGTQVVAAAELAVTTAYVDGPVVQSVELVPEADGLDALVGRRASTGFRAVVDESVHAERGSLGYLLLDEIPAATLVSGFAVAAAAERGDVDLSKMRLAAASHPRLQVPDLCAGFRTGGTMLASMDESGRTPMLLGPVAWPVERPVDEWGWHEIDPLPPHAMRRRRRIDVFEDTGDHVSGGDGHVRVDVFFRDSHMSVDGIETAVHEYTVDAVVDRATMSVVSCEATPRVLPWRECPEAAASARRLAGRPVRGLRPEVRAQFVGPSTCTHLNDVLRGLEDVEWLVDELDRRSARERS